MKAEELVSLYEQCTGSKWESEEGVRWLMQNYPDLDIYTHRQVLDKTAHVTLSDKANWLSQQRCHVCHSSAPISMFPVRIEPESWQALDSSSKKAFKAALAERFPVSAQKPQTGPVCLTFLFVCSKKRRVRDLDNMAKLLMDSIKGILMGDDGEVDHLTLMRLVHEGAEEYVSIRIANSTLNDHANVVLRELRHSWAGAKPLVIGDFRKDG